MKKSFVLILLIGILFSSCASKPVVFDESLAPEEVALIHWDGGGGVDGGVGIIEYNGIAVNWKAPLLSHIDITIPGGNTRFILKGTSGYGVTYKNVPFEYNFEKGKEYFVSMMNDLPTIAIYSGNSRLSMENHIVSFYMSRRGQIIIREWGRVVEYEL